MTVEPSIRRAGKEDAKACHEVMWASITDLGKRHGTPLEGSAADWWASGGGLQRHLASSAAEWWVAEESDSGRIVGFSRAIERGGLLELTELFVLPTVQSRGVGRLLIERAFPSGRGEIRSIIATTDVRALRRYYAAGTAPRFPILTLAGAPGDVGEPGDLTPRKLLAGSAEDVHLVREIDSACLEFARGEAEVSWLLEDREGYVYTRGDMAIGFAFVGGNGCGPIGCLDPADLPDILMHVEGRAKSIGVKQLELQVPAPNEVAARHLLGRGFRIDPWVNLLMTNRPFGRFDRFIGFGPPLFL